MRSKIPIPRSPRNQQKLGHGRGISQWRIWTGRGLLVLFGGVLSAIVGLISQGPDAIRKIPEIPEAVSETSGRVWEMLQIDRGLTGTWESVMSSNNADSRPTSPMRLELESKSGRLLGGLYSPAIKKWTRYEYAMVEGYREGPVLHLNVFDFIGGNRIRLAELTVRFQEPPNEGISDHFPLLVETELQAETIWQIARSLPKHFMFSQVKS